MMRSPSATFNHPKIVIGVLDRESNYKMFKEVCGLY